MFPKKYSTLFMIFIGFTSFSIQDLQAKKSRAHKISKRTLRLQAPHSSIPLRKLKESQLQEILEYIHKHDNFDMHYLVEVLQQMIHIGKDHTQLEKYTLELADIYYTQQEYEKAAATYQSYATTYPGNVNKFEYALYKAILCNFIQTLAPDKDQTVTEKTLELCAEFNSKAHDELMLSEVKDIIAKCHQLMFDKELYVARFYIAKESWPAVQMRLEYIKKTYENSIEDFASAYKKLEEEFTQAQLHSQAQPKRHTHKKKF